MRYVSGGLAGYIFSTIVTIIFTEFLGKNYFIVYATATIITTLFNFFIATHYIFKVKDKYHERFIKYSISVIIFYLANIGLVKLLVEVFKIHYVISITATMSFILFIKFLIHNKIVFQK